METHRIELKAPWQCRRTAAGAVWRRGFNRPTNLGPSERVWVVIEGCPRNGLAALNGQPLGAPEEGLVRLEITGRMALFNQLEIALPSTSTEAGAAPNHPPLAVRLEIEAP